MPTEIEGSPKPLLVTRETPLIRALLFCILSVRKAYMPETRISFQLRAPRDILNLSPLPQKERQLLYIKKASRRARKRFFMRGDVVSSIAPLPPF